MGNKKKAGAKNPAQPATPTTTLAPPLLTTEGLGCAWEEIPHAVHANVLKFLCPYTKTLGAIGDQEARNAPIWASQEQFHTVVLKSVGTVSGTLQTPV